jgi:hypothetical protein
LVFVGEGRLAASLSTFAVASVGLEERRFVIDELCSFRQGDVGTRLSCSLMIGSKLQTGKAEETPTPVLRK